MYKVYCLVFSDCTEYLTLKRYEDNYSYDFLTNSFLARINYPMTQESYEYFSNFCNDRDIKSDNVIQVNMTFSDFWEKTEIYFDSMFPKYYFNECEDKVEIYNTKTKDYEAIGSYLNFGLESCMSKDHKEKQVDEYIKNNYKIIATSGFEQIDIYEKSGFYGWKYKDSSIVDMYGLIEEDGRKYNTFDECVKVVLKVIEKNNYGEKGYI